MRRRPQPGLGHDAGRIPASVLEQVGGRDPECARQLDHRVQARDLPSVQELADLGAMDFGAVGELFLAEAGLLVEIGEVGGEALRDVGHGSKS